jgi:hypothetical protein
MLGQNTATRTAERSLLRSPRAPLGARSSPLRSTSANGPGGGQCLGLPFHSPANTACCQAASTRSTFPVKPFDLPAGISSDPFGLQLPSSRRFHRAGRIIAASPLPDSLPAAQPPLRLSAPLWGFRPRRLVASKRFRGREPALTVRPISLRSPPAPSLITNADRSSFQVRYVPPDSLFREPLGTRRCFYRIIVIFR